MSTAPARILICGGTGFVGSALVARFARAGVAVRVLARAGRLGAGSLPVSVERYEGDLVTGEGLGPALEGVETAYYLVHSMSARNAALDFVEADRRAATHFVKAATRARVGRVVYLGGLGDESGAPSRHLESRREVGRILRSGGGSVTQLRAGIVVGAGGSSFEMMAQLVERLPVMLCPIWIDRRCQPIALTDLVEYLFGCASNKATRGETYDVGGPEILRYSEMLLRIGSQLGRPPCLLVIPRFTPSLSAHWVGYITDVAPELARPVIDGMYVDAVCRDDRVRRVLPIPLTGFDQAVRAALEQRAREDRRRPLAGGHLFRPWEGRVVRLYRSGRAAAIPPPS